MAESDTISIDEIHYPGPNKPKRIKPRSIWKRLLYAAVQCFVIMLIAVPHLTCTFLIIPAWWDFDIGNWKCLTTLLIFNFGIVMIYTNYALACFTNPGAVWGYFPPEISRLLNIQDEDELPTEPPIIRWCRYCRGYKPPRSHHCSQCRRCISKLDHHCPWLDNCVGYYNHGHFMRFLYYVGATTGGLTLLLLFRGREVLWEMNGSFRLITYRHLTTWWELIFIIVDFVIAIAVFLSVGLLALWQTWNIIDGCTTIESWEQDRVRVMVRREKIKEYLFPYDIGALKNMKAVLGDKIYLWPFPQRISGSGFEYEHAPGMEHVVWPPDEYVLERQEPGAAPDRFDIGVSSGSDGEDTSDTDQDSDADNIPLKPSTPNTVSVKTSASMKDSRANTSNNPPRHWRRGSEGYEVNDQAPWHQHEQSESESADSDGESNLNNVVSPISVKHNEIADIIKPPVSSIAEPVMTTGRHLKSQESLKKLAR